MTEHNPKVKTAKGPTILMRSGVYFDYLDPDASHISIDDYVSALAAEPRYRGQTLMPRRHRIAADTPQGATRLHFWVPSYKVAQHAVLASDVAEDIADIIGASSKDREDLAFEALMHESGEPVCGDMTSPLKTLCPDYKAIEKSAEQSIARSFGVTDRWRTTVKDIDNRLWATERRDLLNWSGEEWSHEIQPYDWTIDEVWEERIAYWRFFCRWRALGGERRMNAARAKA